MAGNFINHRLSDKFSHEFVGGPDWNTRFVPIEASGINRRNGGWRLPHHKYTADYTRLVEDAILELRHATYCTRGALFAFRFIDPDDHEADEQSLGTGDGTSDPIQLIKSYTFGPVTYIRPIRLPIDPVVFADEVEIAVTVDPLTGIATPDDPWPMGELITWSGPFDVPVHFARDYNPLSMRGPNLRSTNVELQEEMAPLVEVTP